MEELEYFVQFLQSLDLLQALVAWDVFTDKATLATVELANHIRKVRATASKNIEYHEFVYVLIEGGPAKNFVLRDFDVWMGHAMTDDRRHDWASIPVDGIEADSSRLRPDDDETDSNHEKWDNSDANDKWWEHSPGTDTSDRDFEKYIRWLLGQDLDIQAAWITTATDWELETFRRLKLEQDDEPYDGDPFS